MKIIPITILVFVLSIMGCSSNKTFTIYSFNPDSVVYQDVERFDPEKLVRGLHTDAAFMKRLQKDFTESGSKKVYKPLVNDEGGSGIGYIIVDMKKFFKDSNINDVTIEEADSVEKNYFKQKSIFEFQRMLLKEINDNPPPPPPVVVTAPVSVTTIHDKNEPVLLIQLKSTGDILYRYDAPVNESSFKKITSPTMEKVKKALDALEQQYDFKLDTMEKRILIEGDRNGPFKTFKVVKDAFKAKKIYKFRIVTTSE